MRCNVSKISLFFFVFILIALFGCSQTNAPISQTFAPNNTPVNECVATSLEKRKTCEFSCQKIYTECWDKQINSAKEKYKNVFSDYQRELIEYEKKYSDYQNQSGLRNLLKKNREDCAIKRLKESCDAEKIILSTLIDEPVKPEEISLPEYIESHLNECDKYCTCLKQYENAVKNCGGNTSAPTDIYNRKR